MKSQRNRHRAPFFQLHFLVIPALVAIATPSLAQADELSGAPPLGIVCNSDTPYDFTWSDEAESRQDWAAAVRAERASVAQACDIGYRWLKLARAYALAGQSAEALAAAFYAYQQNPNEVAESIRQTEELAALPNTPGFAASEWGRAWSAAKAARDERQRRGRAQLAALAANARPAEKFVTGETCPFECCTYGEWSVEQEIELFASEKGAKLGKTLKVGDKVVGLTGHVHLRPRAILVQRPFEGYLLEGDWETVPVAAGEIIFELEYLGEGNSAIWQRGRILGADLSGLLTEGCLVLDDSCWGDYLDAPREDAEYQWWVKIRLQDGTEAWALADGFGNMDACG